MQAELDRRLTTPSAALVDDLGRLDGDLVVLGVGGKMGPSLALLARNAVAEAGSGAKVIGVSRFTDGGLRDRLEHAGVGTVAADLLDDDQLAALPDAANVVYMAGSKFGTTGNEPHTWATNAYLPGRVAARYRDARVVVFSTGNVYPLTAVAGGGAGEEHPIGPVGEYAQSCLARERVFDHFARRHGTPTLLLRLNYAADPRTGVLVDVAQAVRDRRPVNLAMGTVNVVWTGHANEVALRCLHHCAAPAAVLNLTGPETVSVRWLAGQFGRRFGVEPAFDGREADSALLSNASRAHALFGYPAVTLGELIDWTARWLDSGQPTLGKPTRFDVRTGEF